MLRERSSLRQMPGVPQRSPWSKMPSCLESNTSFAGRSHDKGMGRLLIQLLWSIYRHNGIVFNVLDPLLRLPGYRTLGTIPPEPASYHPPILSSEQSMVASFRTDIRTLRSYQSATTAMNPIACPCYKICEPLHPCMSTARSSTILLMSKC